MRALPLGDVGVAGGHGVVGDALEEVAEHEVGEVAHDDAGEEADGGGEEWGYVPLHREVSGGEVLAPDEGAE